MADFSMMVSFLLHLSTLLALFSQTEATYANVYAIKGKGETGIGRDGYHLTVEADTPLQFLLIGEKFTPMTTVRFTPQCCRIFSICDDAEATKSFSINEDSLVIDDATSLTTATVDMIFSPQWIGETLQMCTKRRVNESDTSGMPWVYQSNSSWVTLTVVEKQTNSTLLPLPLQIILLIILLCFSGLFSGLNLGLMSLDRTELQVIAKCGTPKERKFANTIKPIRKRGNYLLCTILLGNVLVNNTLTILMDDLTGSGIYAVLASTFCIVIFGEIVPQAICSRHGLAVGARTIWFTKFFMVVTFPLSLPISLLLNLVLGKEVEATYNRDRLRELLLLTQDRSDLLKNELRIINGALELSKKCVKEVMTPLEDVYMVDYNAILDFDTMTEIITTGYTRIPVYENIKQTVVAMLNIKDFGLVDPGDRIPLKTVCHFYNRPVNFVFDDTKLDVVLEEFKKGDSHMSIVQRIHSKDNEDPYYETVGVVTLEDVIEEIIQSEIIDETDMITDNKDKVPRTKKIHAPNFLNSDDVDNRSSLPPQMALATYQYLSTSVECFKPPLLSCTVLERLVKRSKVIQHTCLSVNNNNYIYKKGAPSDFFILILQGEVKVQIGEENITFNGGPFTYFGTNAFAGIVESTSTPSVTLKHLDRTSATSTFSPDFNVEVIKDTTYMKIHRSEYIGAIRATLMENHQRKSQDIKDFTPGGVPILLPPGDNIQQSRQGHLQIIDANHLLKSSSTKFIQL